jgi:hypothetical protein
MLGLLEKARTLRKTLGMGTEDREEFVFDADSGISREEQREIRQEIERVAGKSRIAVTPDMLAVKAAKRGVLFPVLVNVGMFLVLAVGLAFFYFLFQRGETQAAREDTGNITAEGKLLQEVKKESEAKLQEKNSQISQIQGQLADLDKQKQDLQSTMDAKVQEKESALRTAMTAELDAEKARLQKQGLSDKDIEKKLAALEEQKNAAYTRELDAFKAQADVERKRSEATLKNLQDQFSADLAKANTERQQMVADAKQREADLQAQLTAKTKEMASEQARTQAQLSALSSQKAQEDLAAQQLVGLYAVVQSDISDKNYPKALQSLKAITGYINSADVATLPGIANRRSVDLFIVSSLTALVQGEIDAGTVDTASLVDAANTIANVRSLVAGADGLLKAGKLADAETQYGKALAVIPEISRSYAFFTERAAGAEAERREALRAALARAETAFAAGRSAEVLAAYRDAFAYLPETSARLASIAANIGAAATALAAQKSQADQSQAAGPALDAADAALAQGRYADAVAQYVQALQSNPQASQAPRAVRGINDAVAAMNARAAAELKAQADQVAALTAQLTDVRARLESSLAEIHTLKAGIITLLGLKQDPAAADSTALMRQLNQRYGDLNTALGVSSDVKTSLDAATRKNTELTAQVAKLSGDNARLTADLSASRQETERQRQLAAQSAEDLKAAQAAAARAATAAQTTQAAQAAPAAAPALSSAEQRRLQEFDNLVAAYVAYAKQEDANLAANGQQKALMLSIGTRDGFIASLGKYFDGLLGRLKRYESQSSLDGISSGRRAALDDVISVMTGLANQKSPDARRSFLDGRIAAEKDARMKSLLGALQKVVNGT